MQILRLRVLCASSSTSTNCAGNNATPSASEAVASTSLMLQADCLMIQQHATHFTTFPDPFRRVRSTRGLSAPLPLRIFVSQDQKACLQAQHPERLTEFAEKPYHTMAIILTMVGRFSESTY